MCTAAAYRTKSLYFGRTLDYTFSYGEEVVVTPRRFVFHLRHMEPMEQHYGMIGMAHVAGGVPLYYDAVNEAGLAMAGLNFVGNAEYRPPAAGKDNIASFELIPWLLGRCATVAEAKALLGKMNLANDAFSDALPVSQLHWMAADGCQSIVIEATKEGLAVCDNPADVMANNPPFPQQMLHLNQYMHLSPMEPKNTFSDKLPLYRHSRGLGAFGLPGDLSSQSRFVRAAFVAKNSVSGDTPEEGICQLFHILGAVSQPMGSCQMGPGEYEYTIYTSCCDAANGRYYYTTYRNHQITGVDMHRENLDGTALLRFPLSTGEHIRMQN